jgi:hypothetical protein
MNLFGLVKIDDKGFYLFGIRFANKEFAGTLVGLEWASWIANYKSIGKFLGFEMWVRKKG